MTRMTWIDRETLVLVESVTFHRGSTYFSRLLVFFCSLSDVLRSYCRRLARPSLLV